MRRRIDQVLVGPGMVEGWSELFCSCFVYCLFLVFSFAFCVVMIYWCSLDVVFLLLFSLSAHIYFCVIVLMLLFSHVLLFMLFPLLADEVVLYMSSYLL